MATLSKRSTIYLDPALHKALRLKALETSRSMSDIINEALKETLSDDADDLAAFDERAEMKKLKLFLRFFSIVLFSNKWVERRLS